MKQDEACCFINIPGNIRFNDYASKHLHLDKYSAAIFVQDDETEIIYMILGNKRNRQSFSLSWVTRCHLVYTKGLFDRIPALADYNNCLITFRLVEEYNPVLKSNVIRMELLTKKRRRRITGTNLRTKPHKKKLLEEQIKKERTVCTCHFQPITKTISSTRLKRKRKPTKGLR